MTIERRDVGPLDVELDMPFCGICDSGIHFARGDFGPLPLVPGHEIVGVATEVGTEMTRHKVGDRVGIGCMVYHATSHDVPAVPQPRRRIN